MKDLYILASFVILRFLLPHYIESVKNIIALQTIYLYILFDLLFLTAIFILFFIQKKQIPHYFYTVKTPYGKRDFATDIALGLLVALLLFVLAFICKGTQYYHYQLPSVFMSSPKILLVILILGASLSEEIVYRSFLLKRLAISGFALPLSIVCSALLFAISHNVYNLGAFVFGFSAGLLLAVLMALRKSLVANYLAHALYNIGVVFYFYKLW